MLFIIRSGIVSYFDMHQGKKDVLGVLRKA